jgi:hypothetical protein
VETPVFINVIFVFFRVLQTHCCQLEFWSWREKKIPDSFNTKWFPDLFSAFPDLFRIFFPKGSEPEERKGGGGGKEEEKASAGRKRLGLRRSGTKGI